MEGDCARFEDALGDANDLCVSMPITDVGDSEYVTASDSMLLPVCEPSASNNVSVRIERLMQVRKDYGSSDVAFEIEASKDHWSELAAARGSDDSEEDEPDSKIFQTLKEKWGNFFKDQDEGLVVGEKIAEGGQAEIFNAKWTGSDGSSSDDILKVFKEGYSLRDLRKQWPHGMLSNGCAYWSTTHSCLIFGATLLKSGRFAFWMNKYWGDLRKLIDFRMQHHKNRLPPFSDSEVQCILVKIAQGMCELHKHNIVHRDLKASNVLIHFGFMDNSFDPLRDKIGCSIADFESSVGVVGTGYWRAPEILEALQNGDHINKRSDLFTKKIDVYSYAMTCYEVLTGCIPFEDLGASCYSIVIEGRRPKLPRRVNPLLKELLSRCWHGNALERPSFDEIQECLGKIYSSNESDEASDDEGKCFQYVRKQNQISKRNTVKM